MIQTTHNILITRPYETIFVREKFFVLFPDVTVHAQKYFMCIKVIFSIAKNRLYEISTQFLYF
jgi:hypothetical protein